MARRTRHLFKKGDSVRVWWPPTADKAKTDYAGMFWPVTITARESNGKYRVVYDNGETELVKGEHVHRTDAPVDFGREGVDLQIQSTHILESYFIALPFCSSCPVQEGEFVEVFNNSEEDPAAWLARITGVLEDEQYNVTYPFHDEPDEVIPVRFQNNMMHHVKNFPEVHFSQLRRARLHDETKGWVIIKPGQQWEDGEVESPLELETFTPKELAEYIQKDPEPTQPDSRKTSPVVPLKGGVSKKQSKSPARPNRGASKRKGRPERAKV